MFKIKKKRVNENGAETSICFDCRKAVGLCSWSEVDRETNQIRFVPPEGAVYEERAYKLFDSRGVDRALWIKQCPLFDPDPGYIEESQGYLRGKADRGGIIAAFDQGLSIRKIADKLDIAETTVRYWRAKLIKEGILRNPGVT